MDLPKKSIALVKKRDSEMAIMAPPPPPKRIKRPAVVLDEETYLSGLSHIIARDYFPGLVENEAKQELLDALESKDNSWIRDAQKRFLNATTGSTPARRGVSFTDRTPQGYVGDTPRVESGPEAKPEPSIDLNLSLSAFQAKYTSEDNESFSAVLDKQNTKNRDKHTYLWNGNKIPSARQIAYKEREVKLIEAAKNTNALTLYNQDSRPAMPNYTKSAPRNSLMFQPESIEDELVTVAQEAEAKSNAPPKSIVHSNTRIEEPGLPEPQIPASPSLSAINDALAGRPQLNESSAGWETPRVRGYAFVDAEPTAAEILASEGGASDPTAILSKLTKGSDAVPNPFNIKESDKREKLHHRLVDKNKEKKGRITDLRSGLTPGRTPTPKFKSAPQKGNLTPAARLLYDRVKVTSATPREMASSITDFNLTPAHKKSKRNNLLPGLTPKPNVSRLSD
jgi:protein DGCR14